MRPRPKLRTFCRWMLTILTVMLFMAWIGSAFFASVIQPLANSTGSVTPLRISVDEGLVFIWTENKNISGLLFQKYAVYTLSHIHRVRLFFWFWELESNNLETHAFFPLWVPLLILAIPTTLMWRTHLIARRRKAGTCVKCGYDIKGLVGKEACPECWTMFPAEISKASG